jgi:hypothetical protein
MVTKTKETRGGRRMRRARRRQVWMAGGGVALLALVSLGYFAYRATATLPGRAVPQLGNEHIPTETTPHVPYNTDPPTSGPHLPYIAPWGIHTTPIVKELQVHNLEDGGVVVQYNCDCPDLVASLGEIVKRYDKFVILAPYPGMKSRIALTAWGRIDEFEELDERRIIRFIEAFRGIDHHR